MNSPAQRTVLPQDMVTLPVKASKFCFSGILAIYMSKLLHLLGLKEPVFMRKVQHTEIDSDAWMRQM